jgi:hypothetical protein
MQAIGTIEKQAEEWSAEIGWRTRRVNKKISESLIGNYEAPQLLIFAEPNLYVLAPVARFIPGGQGSFDLAIQPSYYTTSLYRDDSGKWSGGRPGGQRFNTRHRGRRPGGSWPEWPRRPG